MAKRLTFQFIGADDIPSALIEAYGGGPVAHVDMLCDDGQLYGAREDNVGGAPPGVQFRQPRYKKINRLIRIELAVTEQQHADFWKFAMAQKGKPYDKSVIAGFVLDRDWRDPGEWTCSEWPPAAMEVALILPTLLVPDNKITPAGLGTIVTAIGGKIAMDRTDWP